MPACELKTKMVDCRYTNFFASWLFARLKWLFLPSSLDCGLGGNASPCSSPTWTSALSARPGQVVRPRRRRCGRGKVRSRSPPPASSLDNYSTLSPRSKKVRTRCRSPPHKQFLLACKLTLHATRRTPDVSFRVGWK